MKRRFNALMMMALVGLCSVGMPAIRSAHGMAPAAEVRIIDRETGAALTPHWYRGELWVAGTPGARYAIDVRNRLGERLLAVASVDGLNAISGRTAGWDQVGYVLGAGQHYEITGWRKSDAEVAAFSFADAGDSYAAHTGRPANIGIIGIALFRERLPVPIPIGESVDRMRAAESATDAAAPSAAAKLGTAHGERESSWVARTEFERRQTEPDQIVRIHYDSLEHLYAMGILPRARARSATLDPFPATPAPEYVPDPPA